MNKRTGIRVVFFLPVSVDGLMLLYADLIDERIRWNEAMSLWIYSKSQDNTNRFRTRMRREVS